MRLLILRGSSQHVNPLYYNVQELGLGKVLARRGWSVRIISSGDDPRAFAPFQGVEWIDCKRVGLSRNLGWPEHALDLINEFSPDIIQVQDILTPSTLLAFRASTREGVPLVLSMGEYPDGRTTRTVARRLLAGFMRSKYSAVLCKTQMAATYCDSLGLPSVSVCPVGIDPELYAPISDYEQLPWFHSLRGKRVLGHRVLCHVGRLDKLDNIPFLVQVMAHLPDEYELLLAGEPQDYARKIAREAGVEHRISTVGSVPNRLVGAIFENSLATLSCSVFEPFGLSAVESLYHGCPVFAHPTGGIVDIIENGQNGIHIRNRSPKEWACVIHKTIQTGVLQKISITARARRRELTWSHRALAYEKVYKRVIQR